MLYFFLRLTVFFSKAMLDSVFPIALKIFDFKISIIAIKLYRMI